MPAPAKLVVPGNHDIPLLNLALRAVAPFARFSKAFGPELEPMHDDAQLLVIGVNTVMPIWHKQGAVSESQNERICRLLRKGTPSQVRIVVCHHPVHVIRPEDDKNLLRGAEQAVPQWVEAGADLVLGGHIHLPYFRPLRQRFPDLPRRAWVAQAGTAVSSRIRSGICNSVNFVQPIDGGDGAALPRRALGLQRAAECVSPHRSRGPGPGPLIWATWACSLPTALDTQHMENPMTLIRTLLLTLALAMGVSACSVMRDSKT